VNTQSSCLAHHTTGLLLLYKTDEKGGVPAHVICSAFADWAYEHVGLPSPRGTNGKYTTPADWDEFIMNEGWN
jgi:hypothetical protein